MDRIEISGRNFDAQYDVASVPVLATRGLVLFPGIVFPISLVRESSRRLVEYAEQTGSAVLVSCQLDENVEFPALNDLYHIGVLAQVLKVLTLPNDTALAMVMAAPFRAEILGEAEARTPLDGTLWASVRELKETGLKPNEKFNAKLKTASQMVKELGNMLTIGPGAQMDISTDGNNPVTAVNLMSATAPLPTLRHLELLDTPGPRARLDRLTDYLQEEIGASRVRAEIENSAREKMNRRQRSAILEAQMESIREELYGEQSDTSKFRDLLANLLLEPETNEAIEREIGRLEHMSPQSPDYQTQHAYLDTVLKLPWNTSTSDHPDFAEAEEILNRSHSGLEKVKERVLEHIAVMRHGMVLKAPILCLVGPPGVGKTSLGESIARALGRKFQRVSLGGVSDEAEIRGHRRTYIGAMPGRIIEAIRRAGTSNPVIMLDEVDKLGQDYKSRPSSALLEVLDPEQNSTFHDNYIDLDFSLQSVMFITTANTLDTIEAPLLDRMEVIRLSGYSAEEKMEIAREHLIPRILVENWLEPGEIEISPEAIAYIIDNYTAESGVRQLQKQLESLIRKFIRAKVSGREFPRPVGVKDLRGLLGLETNSHDRYSTDGTPGVVTGLAWTAAGGEILFIEAVTTPGKGEARLTLTGNLGDVMKESAAIAHRYALAHASELGISPEQAAADLHIHVPEGAIPKDGPSAGITMTTAIVSAMTGRPVRKGVAMTGEITLRGKVLPVGGIKEKILAARRAGISEIILSEENRRNVEEEIKAEYKVDMTFRYVTRIDEVLNSALAE